MKHFGKILMLDDDSLMLDIYYEFLEAKGYGVFATTNAYQFIRYARELNPDILILDINMPRLNGWEVLHIIKEDAKLKDIPVIILSVERDWNLARMKGASHYMCKPTNLENLLEIVEAYCKGGRKDDLLMVGDLSEIYSPLKQSINDDKLKYFSVYGLEAARRYLDKNSPQAICLCDDRFNLEEVKARLPHKLIFRADKSDNIQNFMY